MTKRTPRAVSVESILADHSPDVRDLAERLRALVHEVVPDAIESAYPGWHAIGYRHPQAGYFCGIFPLAERVELGFEHGVLLPNTEGLLQGTGKRVRYIEVHSSNEVQADVIKKLLRIAVSLKSR